MNTLSGTLATGYVAEVGETPQTPGDLSDWIGIEAGQTLTLTTSGTFGTTTRITVQATESPVGGSVTTIDTISAANTYVYTSNKKLWYRVYFLTQDGSEEISYEMGTVAAERFAVDGLEATIFRVTDAGASVYGTLNVTGNISQGVSGTGADVLTYGATSYMQWDASADTLIFGEGAAPVLNDTATTKAYKLTVESGVLTLVEV